jgi:hypothetical protein
MTRWIVTIASRILSRHAYKQRRMSVKERARLMREQMGLPPLEILG